MALFAWTISGEITAAFLGISYWAAGIFELASGRDGRNGRTTDLQQDPATITEEPESAERFVPDRTRNHTGSGS